MENRKFKMAVSFIAIIALIFSFVGCDLSDDPGDDTPSSASSIDLDDLSIESMRAETFGGNTIEVLEQKYVEGGTGDFQLALGDASSSYNTYMATYDSDGLRVYTRIDIPNSTVNPMPIGGYPVIIFGHGWVGDKAGYNFNLNDSPWYGPITDGYVDNGFVVVYPGFRAHGTVSGVAAEGQDYIDNFDNGSYISPLFYGRDILHLLEDLDTLNDVDWSADYGMGSQYGTADAVQFDLSSIHVTGHSNAGDAILTALAVSGEGSTIANEITSADIWSGCFPTRYDQVEQYYPIRHSFEAFQAGTGSMTDNGDDTFDLGTFEWNATATGSDTTINPNFVHGWPYDWFANSSTETDINNELAAWAGGWQGAYYLNLSTSDSLLVKYGEMIDTLNDYVEGYGTLTVGESTDGTADTVEINYGAVVGDITTVTTTLDPTLKTKLDAMSAVNYPEYLIDEDILFQYSDRDFYSWQSLNEDLRDAINAETGGNAGSVKYAGHTHELKLSSKAWYRNSGAVVDTTAYPTATRAGYNDAIQNGVNLATDGTMPLSDTFQ